ncbi:MAG: LPS-assembly protein LptD, partial [Rhodospirillaceae bacterium]|nr:LPS-assembly protein LptD [Rhodospirillaceae bacterium]
RFTGFDKIESGPRINYGVKWGVYGDGGGSTNLMIGQSYRPSVDDTFNQGSGIEEKFSDYVGMIKVSPSSKFNMLYRTRIDKKTHKFHSNEVGVNGSVYDFSYNANYSFFAKQPQSEFLGREEINYSLGYKLADYWSVSYGGINDLARNGGQRLQRTGITYDDECFTFNASFSRTFYQDREIKPTDIMMFRLVFKTVGEVNINQSIMDEFAPQN